MSYTNYLDVSNDLITTDLIYNNNKIIIGELQKKFQIKGFDSLNIIGKGDTAKNLRWEYNTIGINQSLMFTSRKFLFMNDFESLFGIEHLICSIKYLFLPYYPHVNCGKQVVKFTEFLDFLKLYNFKGKLFIYELNTSKEKGKLKDYNLHELDTTLTCILFFKKYLPFIKKFNLYGCYKSNYYHKDLLNLNIELNKDNKYGFYIKNYNGIFERAKTLGRQSYEKRLKELHVDYVLH